MATKEYRKIVRFMKENGWIYERTNGSHEIYRHIETGASCPIKKTKKDIPAGTVSEIERITGLKF